MLSPSLHLHFVAHAKHCHPKSPTNLPPYGSSPQKETAVAWQSHTAPSASAGHVVEERDGLPPCITHSHPLYLPLSKSFIRCLMDHPLPLPITPPKKILLIISSNEESLCAWIYELLRSHGNPRATLYLRRGIRGVSGVFGW